MGLLNVKALMAIVVLCHCCITLTVAEVNLPSGNSLAEGEKMVAGEWEMQNKGGTMSLYHNGELKLGGQFVTSDPCTLTMQGGGNLVTTDDTSGAILYSAGTEGEGNYLTLREDGYYALLHADGSEIFKYFQG